MSNESNNPDQLSKTQEKILLELEMILTTVKQIDANILKSINSLAGDGSYNHSANSIDRKTQEGYKELVKKNVSKITDILKMLDSF